MQPLCARSEHGLNFRHSPIRDRMESEPGARNPKVERLSAIFSDSVLDALPRTLFNQRDHTASAPRTANFGRPRSVPSGHCDQLVDKRSANARGVGAPQLPFFTYQALNVIPPLAGERTVH